MGVCVGWGGGALSAAGMETAVLGGLHVRGGVIVVVVCAMARLPHVEAGTWRLGGQVQVHMERLSLPGVRGGAVGIAACCIRRAGAAGAKGGLSGDCDTLSAGAVPSL